MIYEGPAKRLVPTNTNETNYDTVVYVVEKGNAVFAVFSRPIVVCYTVIHGLVLYDTFGLSMKILVAVWDSVTAYCIHRERRRQEQSNQQKPAEMTDVVVVTAVPATAPGVSEVQPVENFTSAKVYPEHSWIKS